MPTWAWRSLAEAQHGVVTRAQLGRRGSQAIATMVARGEIARVACGVYLVGGAPWTLRSRLWAAVLATDGILGFASGAHLWGMSGEAPHRIHGCVPHDRRPRGPNWIALHRVEVPPTVRQRRAGLPVTSRAWTVMDVLGTLPVGDAMTVADRALQQGWIRVGDVRGRLERYPGRAGNRRLRRLAATLGDGAAAQSERMLHRLLRQAGLAGWQPNYDVWAAGYLVAVVDVAIVERRLAIEVDGHAHHSDVDRFRRDRHRQNALVQLGWTVVRFTWFDLTQRSGYVVATIRRVLGGSGTEISA